MTELLTYSKFYDYQALEEITNILENENIGYNVEEDKPILDKVYIGESLDTMIVLKISSDDFDRANESISQQLEIDIDAINKGYYLFQFSIEELKSVVASPFEWNYFDRALAKKLLNEKGVSILEEVKNMDVGQLYQPIGLSPQWIILEYFASIILLYAGLLIGLVTLIAYKTLPNGKRVRIYNDATRYQAKIILGVGVLRFLYFLKFSYLI